ncbi:hypothetical protein IRB23SM22_00080 [Alkalibacterium sp. s-m-22]
MDITGTNVFNKKCLRYGNINNACTFHIEKYNESGATHALPAVSECIKETVRNGNE